MKNWHRLLIAGLVVVALAAALTLIASGGQDSLAVDGTIYVDVDAAGANNGTSWGDAFTDLQLALDEAVATDQIWVAAGVYTPTQEFSPGNPRSATFQMKNGVAIYGGFDPGAGDIAWEDRDWKANPTILSGDIGIEGDASDNVYHVFYHPASAALDSTAILDGFTITGGYAHPFGPPHDWGAGMYNEGSSPTLGNCTFQGNSAAAYGGGMHNTGGSAPALTNCTFQGNLAGINGGGMYNMNGSSPVLTDCTFADNSAAFDGGGMYNSDSSPTLIHCTFSGNTADQGGGMVNGASSPALTDCTFAGNSADIGGGMYNGWIDFVVSSPMLTNCTFAGNLASSYGGGMLSIGGSPALTNCTFEGNSAGTSGGGIYNKGVDFAVSSPALTNSILWGNAPDQILNDGMTPAVSYSDIQGGYSGTGNIDADPLFMDAPNGDYHLGPGSPCIDAGNNLAPLLPPYDFEGDRRVVDGNRDGTIVVDMGVDEVYEAPPPVIFVDLDANGDNNGASWADALTDLQVALAWAEEGVEIWVAAGIYKPMVEHGGTGDRYRSFQLKNGVAIYGGFDPDTGDVAFEDRDWEANLTILSGDIGIGGDASDNVYHVFYHPAGTGLESTAILDGFTVTGGNANGADAHRLGGGMYNETSSPTLTNCKFQGNSGTSGGGMYNWGSSPTLTNCTFEGNSATGTGGGMHNEGSSPMLTDCTFADNSTALWGGGMFNAESSPVLTGCSFADNSAELWGGGMLNAGSAPVLTDCTFSGNSANTGGGMYDISSSAPVLTHCSFLANLASVGSGMYNEGSSPTLTDCTFSGNSATTGGGMYNLGSDPALTNCTFSGNSASHNGGGMYNSGSDPTLTGCSFSGNSAGASGGGMYNDSASPALTKVVFSQNDAYGSADLQGGGGMFNWSSSPTLINVTFSQNVAHGPRPGTKGGGGMYNYYGSSPALTDCTFSGNLANWGGGMFNLDQSSPVLTNCTFEGNSSGYLGGGMASHNGSSPTLTNCTFWENWAESRGGGMSSSLESDAVLTNCTFWGNLADWDGGGMANIAASTVLTNCIVWGNTPDQIVTENRPSTISYSDIEGGCEAEDLNDCGAGNIDADPLFLDPGNGDFHLRPGSPCVDAGDNTAPNLPPYDFEGDDRILDGNHDGTAIVDMGVDEAIFLRVYLPLVLRGH